MKSFFIVKEKKSSWKRFLVLLGIVIISVLALHYLRQYFFPSVLSHYLADLPDRSKISVYFNQRQFVVEVVNTPSSIRQGLSDRREIGADGMLFVLPDKKQQSFWMPRMHFDLDILWLDENTVTQISRKIPAPPINTPNWKLPLYTSNQAVNLVLEIPAGRADLMGIKIGDQLQLKP